MLHWSLITIPWLLRRFIFNMKTLDLKLFLYSQTWKLKHSNTCQAWSSLLKNEKGNTCSKKIMQINIQNNEPTVHFSTCLIKHCLSVRELSSTDNRKKANQPLYLEIPCCYKKMIGNLWLAGMFFISSDAYIPSSFTKAWFYPPPLLSVSKGWAYIRLFSFYYS